MDRSLILEFPDRAKAALCLVELNMLVAETWRKQGYTVKNGKVMPKNSMTGEDMPDACHTISWDVVCENKDGKCYIASPNTKNETAENMALVPKLVYSYNEKPMPEDWRREQSAQEPQSSIKI